MLRRLFSRWTRRPSPYQALKVEYAAARAAFEEAKDRKDTRDMARWLGEQSRLLPELLRWELRL